MMHLQPLHLGDDASFVRDMTHQDGDTVRAGSTIIKTWRIRNSGNVEWKDRVLKIEGDANGFELVQSPPFSAAPNSEVNVSVVLKVPDQKGRYKVSFKQWVRDGTDWKLALPNKLPVFIDVIVE